MFFLHFMLFPTFLEKNSGNKKNNNLLLFFGNIEKCPFTYWLSGRWFHQIVDIGNFNMKLNGRWLPQIVDRDSGNLYPIYITKIYIQYIYKKKWCYLLNLLAGDIGRPSCLVVYCFSLLYLCLQCDEVFMAL